MDKKITIFEKKELNYDENEFMTLHNKIIETGQMATVYIYEMAKLLKEMHDSKKYIVAGFESFEAYTESQLNIKKSQAYKYINIVETFSIEFFHSSGKNMGVSKLALLANLTEDGANEFIEHHDVENMSLKELQAELDKVKRERSEFLNQAYDYQAQVKKLNEQNANLQLQINKPVDPIIKEIKVEDTARIEELEKLLSAAEAEKQQYKDKLSKSKDKDKIKELTTSLEVSETKYNSLVAEKEALEKKLILAGNEEFNKFKVLFEVLQLSYKNVKRFIDSINDDAFKEKCINAVKALIGGYK